MVSMENGGVRRIGVADPATPRDAAPLSVERLAAVKELNLPLELEKQVVEPSTGVVEPQKVVDPETGYTYDPCEYLPMLGSGTQGARTGLVARCQQGRFDSWHDRRTEQCHNPAMRGMNVCSSHGGVAVAKKLLQENAVLMMDELIRIALDPDEKTADKLAALNSGLDRTGGLGRTVAQPEPEVRSALMARLEAAYDAVVEQQKSAGQVDGSPGVVAVQTTGESSAELENVSRETDQQKVDHAVGHSTIIVGRTNPDPVQ